MLKSFFRPNGWLVLFVVLLLLNFGGYLYIKHKLSDSGETIQVRNEQISPSSNVLTLQPDIIDGFIQKDNTKDMKLKLSGQQLMITQQSRFIGQSIQTNILTTPAVIGHNQLRLKINDIKVANLPLSKQQTINLVKNFGSLPSNVKLDAASQCFYYTMKPIKLGANELVLTAIDDKGWHFNVELKEE